MSPAVEDFLSPSSSSTQRSYFQNPNPSAQEHIIDSGIFNNSFNLMNSSKLDFDCSNDAAAAAATVRSSRRKHVKVKKQSSCNGSVSKKSVNSTGDTDGFVFNATTSGSVLSSSLGQTGRDGNGERKRHGETLDTNLLRFSIGATHNGKLGNTMSSEEVHNIGNKFQPDNINFVFGAGDEKADTRTASEKGADKFGKLNDMNFVFGVKINNGALNSNSSKVEHECRSDGVALHVDDSESSGTVGKSGIDFMKVKNFTTMADSHLVDSMSFLNLGSRGSGEAETLMNNNLKTEENNKSDGRSFENLGFVFSANHKDLQTGSNIKKQDSKEKVDKLAPDSVDRNVDSGIMFGNSKVNGTFHIGTHNEKRSSFKENIKLHDGINITKRKEAGSHDYLKKQEDNRDSVLDGNSTFVFGSNVSNPISETPLSKVSNGPKTSNIHDPIKLGTTSNKINEAGTTNNFSFASKVSGFGASFTGFNTPDINVPTSFTSDMFPGLSKKLDFSKIKSVSQRKTKKIKAKLKQQSRNCPLSEEVPQSFEESSGCCSPMEVSPYWATDSASTSTNPATSQVQNEDAVDNTKKPNSKNISPSVTSLGVADVAVKQRPHQKKYKLRTGRVDVSHAHKPSNREHAKATDEETCDNWRKRGNEAYKSGNLSEAEVCYSKGISSIQHTETPGVCIEPLLLCYSNRAATRMALGRMREGLKDCRMAAALDPSFMKANLRSANCHLLLGEIDDASDYYNKCLESGENVCLDRRITIEAADGLQKAQKVAEHLKLATELLEQKTHESATNVLGTITDALSVSCYSEKLLNMKGEALLVLGKHKEVVQLCEQTLDLAERNFDTACKNSLKLWRWTLMSKSYFHLGRLETALDLIEKHEQLRNRIVGPEESLTHLAVTIRELLHCKNAGNEAFQNGKHTEAVEHYTAAISKSIESHSFAAVCFCNRAAANQSLGEIIDAIGDCSIAIALDTSYPKALSRRATLLEMIRDYKHASDDLQRLISILESQSQNSHKSSASNGSVKDLRRARRRLSILQEKAKKDRSLDLYLILGLKASDGAPDVKKAYRKAALRHHPDKVSQQWKAIAESIQMDADRLFKMIGEAYAVLSDSTKRSKYDLEEEMWDEMEVNVGSSNRRSSDFYGSQESRKTYGNSQYYYWQDPRKSYHSSYPRW